MKFKNMRQIPTNELISNDHQERKFNFSVTYERHLSDAKGVRR